MAPKLSHPFLDGLKDIPEGKKKDLLKIKTWMNTQAHLPTISDEYIYLFLHACYYSQEKTKSAIENYFTIRSNHPAIFADRDTFSPRMQTVLDMGAVSHSKAAAKNMYMAGNNVLRGQAHKRHFPCRILDNTDARLFPRAWTPVFKNSYQTGILARTFSNEARFHMHPEKLKQIMKEQYGQNLCNYYDSDVYKQKAAEVVEEQSRIINEGTPSNLRDTDIIYEHMLNCAQPRHKPKLIVVQKIKEEEDTAAISVKPKKRVVKRAITPNIFRKKKPENSGLPVSKPQIVYAHEMTEKKQITNIKDCRRKYRKRTTILPLYLKRIQENMARKEKNRGAKSPDNTAQKFSQQDKINYDAQLLNTRKRIYINKSKHTGNEGEDANDARDESTGEEVGTRTSYLKPQSKYSLGDENQRHWYQHQMAKKFAELDTGKDESMTRV